MVGPNAGNTTPTITTQPAAQTVSVGANVSFSVVATGTPAPTYQWRKDGTNISRAANATLTLNNVQTGDAGSYTVTVSNPAGSVTSAGATLTVNVPPTITAQPQGRVVVTGNNVTFSVSASGTAPLSYQWTFNGSPIPGATSATLTLNNVQQTNSGTYAVVVSNAAGSTTSTAATLTVNSPPNKPPTVEIISPTSGAVFTALANININASANDSDGNVTKVEFFSNATKLGEAASTPFNYSWQNVPPGNYSLTARATDNQGATTNSVSVNITVTKANQTNIFDVISDKV